MTLTHESGATSQASFSVVAPVDDTEAWLRLFTEEGELRVDLTGAESDPATVATLRAEFAATAASGRPHHLDAERALHLQRLLARALA